MKFLYFLEDIRIPVLNEVMLAITSLGEETAFLVIALILFWCVDKYIGYYTLSVGFVGMIVSQFMKLWFRIPRPWVLDSDFTVLEQAKTHAADYSFPSGHTVSAVCTYGSIANTAKNRLLRYLCVAISVLVGFSRMYIGVHTPKDVLVGALLAVVLVFALRPLVLGNNRRWFPALLTAMLLLAVGYLCFAEFYLFPVNVDLSNLLSGIENGYTLLGGLLGIIVVYVVDEKWLRFDTKAVWWVQIVKVAIGLVLVLIIKTGLKAPLNALLGVYAGRTVRYFLTVVAAGIVWPLSFKWFSQLGRKDGLDCIIDE